MLGGADFISVLVCQERDWILFSNISYFRIASECMLQVGSSHHDFIMLQYEQASCLTIIQMKPKANDKAHLDYPVLPGCQKMLTAVLKLLLTHLFLCI